MATTTITTTAIISTTVIMMIVIFIEPAIERLDNERAGKVGNKPWSQLRLGFDLWRMHSRNTDPHHALRRVASP